MLVKWRDERVAGTPHFSFLPKGETLAYFPNELLRCVAFVGFKDQHGTYHFAGSGFWIARPGPDDIKDIYRPAYFVTAKHVIKKIHAVSADKRVWLRLNTKTEGQTWYETPKDSWVTHPTDETVDLAVLKIGIDDTFDHVTWPLESCVLADNLDVVTTGDRKIELGDELCFAGLFYPHEGKRRNIPIVRIGNIAALRNEPVLSRDSVPMDVYLVECRSIGGLSGSPVFIDIITAKNVSPPSRGFLAPAYPPDSPTRFKLFGVIHGHFGDDPEPDATVNEGNQKLGVNFGIAMVIPAEKITEVLGQFSEAEKLEAEDTRNRKLSRVIPDIR
jgi:hypothetical protein